VIKLPTKSRTRVQKSGQQRYEVTVLFLVKSRAKFEEMISLALTRDDNVLKRTGGKTVTLISQDIKTFEDRINSCSLMGIPGIGTVPAGWTSGGAHLLGGWGRTPFIVGGKAPDLARISYQNGFAWMRLHL